jgi:hypothetical protein
MGGGAGRRTKPRNPPLNFEFRLCPYFTKSGRLCERSSSFLWAAGMTRAVAIHPPRTPRAAGRLIETPTFGFVLWSRRAWGRMPPPVVLGAGAANLLRGRLPARRFGDALHTRTRPNAGRCAKNFSITAIPLCDHEPPDLPQRICPRRRSPAGRTARHAHPVVLLSPTGRDPPTRVHAHAAGRLARGDRRKPPHLHQGRRSGAARFVAASTATPTSSYPESTHRPSSRAPAKFGPPEFAHAIALRASERAAQRVC